MMAISAGLWRDEMRDGGGKKIYTASRVASEVGCVKIDGDEAKDARTAKFRQIELCKSMHEMGRTLHELGVVIKFAGRKMHFLTREFVILQG